MELFYLPEIPLQQSEASLSEEESRHIRKVLRKNIGENISLTDGKGKLAKMLSVMCIGDFTSVYLAILQNKDPTPVDIIVRVKSELAKKTRMKERFEAELAKLK